MIITLSSINQRVKIEQVYSEDNFLCGIGCWNENKENDARGLLDDAVDTDERIGFKSSNDEEGNKRRTIILLPS